MSSVICGHIYNWEDKGEDVKICVLIGLNGYSN
jgi:hypothetical protein